MDNDRSNDRILRMGEFQSVVGIKARSGVYDKLNPKSPRYEEKFPKPIKIGQRAIGFSEIETQEYLAARRAARDAALAAQAEQTDRAAKVQERVEREAKRTTTEPA